MSCPAVQWGQPAGAAGQSPSAIVGCALWRNARRHRPLPAGADASDRDGQSRLRLAKAICMTWRDLASGSARQPASRASTAGVWSMTPKQLTLPVRLGSGMGRRSTLALCWARAMTSWAASSGPSARCAPSGATMALDNPDSPHPLLRRCLRCALGPLSWLQWPAPPPIAPWQSEPAGSSSRARSHEGHWRIAGVH